jgi:5-methylcytosine-specific restriction enzyme subunit McrC
MSVLKIDIREWEQLLPEKGSPLFHKYIEDEASRYTIKMLNEKGVVNILELKDGLQITSNSYVGKIKIGDIELNIHPKIEGMPLYKLLKYAYGLRDLNIFDEAVHDIASSQFYDLLIYQLYAEIEEMLYRGLNKRYKKHLKRNDNKLLLYLSIEKSPIF